MKKEEVETEEVTLDSLVNETLKIKKVENITLNETFNQVYESTIIPNTINTEKK